MGSFEGSIGTPAGGFTLLVEYDYTQNTSANTTTFSSIRGYVKRNKSSYYPYNRTSAVALTVNGSTYTASPAYNLGSDGYKQIISVSNITISHNADGTKTTSIGLSMDGKLSNYYPNGSISQSITLPTIPRASSVSASTANIGGAMNITVSRASSAFTHSLFYKYGSTGWVRIATGVATSYQWTVPTSLYSAIPNSNSLALTIEADTYSGSTMIGSKTCTTTVYVANSDPTCTLTAKDVNAATIALTGSATKMVRYMSNIQYTATPAAKNAATIAKTTTSCSDGQSSTALTGTFTGAGGNKITAVTVDSRGNKGEALTVTLPMVDYFRPVIKEATLYRINTTSATVKLDYALSCFVGDFGAASNTFALSFRWREAVEGATWSEWAEITTAQTSETGHVLGEAYDWHKAYDFELRLEDKLASTTVVRSVTKGIPIAEIGEHDVKVNGDSTITGDISIGGAAQIAGGLQVNGMAVMEFGSVSSKGYYLKFYDGTMIQWYTMSCSGYTASNAYVSLYYFTMPGFTFPIPFVGYPTTLVPSINSNWYVSSSIEWYDNTQTGRVFVYAVAQHKYDFKLSWIAVGRWK